MPKPLGMLVAAFDFSGVPEDEFHDWYDTEHVPERLAMRGFLNAQRWIGIENPKTAVATYDLEHVGVLLDPVYVAAKGDKRSPWSRRMARKTILFCRLVGEQIAPGDVLGTEGAGGLLIYAMNVKPEAEADFNAWYDTEHLLLLAAVPGCLRARRFRSTEGAHKYFALYHLSTPEVAGTRAWKDSRSTPWTKRIGPSTSDHLRILLRRYERTA
jgi:hypothetical protein